MRTVFVHPERCIGCLQCEYACAVEHSASRDPVAALFELPPPRRRVHVEAGPRAGTAFPNRCRHCDPAPCQQVCPTGAIFRDVGHDAVLIDVSRCIACAMCAMVCPFDVITYHELADGADGRTVAVKCDACVTRLDEGRIPACAEVCKVGALEFGELNEIAARGRLHETAVVLAAAGSDGSVAPDVPETVEAWRTLGEAVASTGQAGGAR